MNPELLAASAVVRLLRVIPSQNLTGIAAAARSGEELAPLGQLWSLVSGRLHDDLQLLVREISQRDKGERLRAVRRVELALEEEASVDERFAEALRRVIERLECAEGGLPQVNPAREGTGQRLVTGPV